MLQTIRRAGGSLVMTIPKAFAEQNNLNEGSHVSLHLEGNLLIVRAQVRPHYKLTDLMAEMRNGLPVVGDWNEMPSVDLEQG